MALVLDQVLSANIHVNPRWRRGHLARGSNESLGGLARIVTLALVERSSAIRTVEQLRGRREQRPPIKLRYSDRPKCVAGRRQLPNMPCKSRDELIGCLHACR